MNNEDQRYKKLVREILERGLATPDEIQDCLNEIKDEIEEGAEALHLSRVLIRRGVLPKDKLKQLEHEIGSILPLTQSFESQELKAGQKIGKYEIISEIARGGMAIVYEAIGFFFDGFEELVTLLQQALIRKGFRCELNKPYTGVDGDAYATHHHGQKHHLIYWGIEINNSLLTDPETSAHIGRQVADAVLEL